MNTVAVLVCVASWTYILHSWSEHTSFGYCVTRHGTEMVRELKLSYVAYMTDTQPHPPFYPTQNIAHTHYGNNLRS